MPDSSSELIARARQATRERHFADAQRDLLLAVEQLRRAGSPIELANALRSLGEVERRTHDPNAARAHYEEAVALYRGVDDPCTLAHTIRHLGDVHSDSGQLELAAPCYDEALSLYRGQASPPPLDLANAIRSCAALNEKTGDIDLARQHWAEAMDLYKTVGVGEGVAECASRLAVLNLNAADDD